VKGVDVSSEAQSYHVCFEPVDHRASLFARPSVRLLDGDLFAALGQVILSESLVKFFVKLACWIIGDIEEMDGVCRHMGYERAGRTKEGEGSEERSHREPD
jgi:hypothetical protein